MAEHAILLQPAKIRTIWDWDFVFQGTMQTRGPCKDQVATGYEWVQDLEMGRAGRPYTGWVKHLSGIQSPLPTRCPYGKPGDTLWVREAYWHERGADFENAAFDDGLLIEKNGRSHQMPGWSPRGRKLWKKRSPILMPRWACRLFLELVSGRVQALQDITGDDMIAEGIEDAKDEDAGGNFYRDVEWMRDEFQDWWDSIYAKPKPVRRGGQVVWYQSWPWADLRELRDYRGLAWYVQGNPRVWVGEFKRKEHD